MIMRYDSVQALNGLKGIAILSVVLYHLGFLENGYLGVDLFLVINGFLITKSILKQMEKNTFTYGSFLIKRMVRLYPLILVAAAFCLFIGYIGMLPDDYENLCQTIVATNLFSNNILSGITTKNYWDVVNEYKPLMHTWYLGILAEFYILFPLILMLIKKITDRYRLEFNKYNGKVMAVLTLLSFIFYIAPIFEGGGIKFYFLPARFFELGIGALVYIYRQKLNDTKCQWIPRISILLLLVIMACGGILPDGTLPDGVWLIMTVVISALLVGAPNEEIKINRMLLCNPLITFLGKRSYSIYIWHQVILAFYRYFVSKDLSVGAVMIYMTAILLLALVSYRYIENTAVANVKTAILLSIIGFMISLPAGLIYLNAGVVRDVPELDITVQNAHRNMHAEYNARIYEYNKEFPQNEKSNVLVVGNSFARDWANIMLESELSDKINLSYSFTIDENLISRIKSSDYIFFYYDKAAIPQAVFHSISDKTQVWGIGTKNFGESNGIIYSNRFEEDYFEQSIVLAQEFEEDNRKRREEWGQNYIDLIEICRNADGTIPVFSPEYKMISQDCRHLTHGGAQYFAEKIDFDKIYNY